MIRTTPHALPIRSKNPNPRQKAAAAQPHTIPISLYKIYLSLHWYAIVIILSPVPHSQHSLTRITFYTPTASSPYPFPLARPLKRALGLVRSQSRSHARVCLLHFDVSVCVCAECFCTICNTM